MLVTDKFVFVHLPRSGGTFISDLIRKFFPSAREIGYHFPRELLPAEYTHLPVLGAVRNPWDFYVSWYYHVWPRDAATPLIAWVTENGTLDFYGSARNAINFAADAERFDKLIESMPEAVDYGKKHIPNITRTALRKIRGVPIGYYSFRFNHLFGNPDDIFICRLENLREDLLAFFETIGAVTDDLRDYVLGENKKNTSEHLHYSAYYTPELAELVAVRDRALIEKFGYAFQQPHSAAQAR